MAKRKRRKYVLGYEKSLYAKSERFRKTKLLVNTRWRNRHKEAIKKKRRANYLENREEIIATTKKWHDANKERTQQNQRKYLKNLLDNLHQVYGDKCVCCGESERIFLTLDHIDGGGSADYKKGRVTALRRIIKERDPTKYRILCWNCNMGRQRNGGICPHQFKKQTLLLEEQSHVGTEPRPAA